MTDDKMLNMVWIVYKRSRDRQLGSEEGFLHAKMDSVLSNNRESHNSSMPASKSMSVIKSIIHLL